MCQARPSHVGGSGVIGALVPDLTDFPFGPENVIVKEATPEMALNPLYDPKSSSFRSTSMPVFRSVQPMACAEEHELSKEPCRAEGHCVWLSLDDAQRSVELHGERQHTP